VGAATDSKLLMCSTNVLNYG